MLGACAAAWAGALLEARPGEPDLEQPARLEPSLAAPDLAPERADAAPSRPPAAAPQSEDGAPPLAADPLSGERVRIQRELQLIAALNDALDRRDVSELRKLLKAYRAHDPRDEQGLQAGYQCLADCLEQPGAASSAAARVYYERERASVLRRYIRRTCLEREL